ncbi:uncharacterized protein LOC134241293 [Saccostrea cucullata]|uniref:uncharacterized protein LOC134241293 n=1 Tax=Saccostrea cuccullata TaxID=36930 RepID=UPI002ED58DE6
MPDESDENDSDCQDSFFLGMIDTGHVEVNTIENWMTTLQLNNTDVQFLMDTGPKCYVLTRDTYHKLKMSPLEKPKASLTSYSGHKIIIDGSNKDKHQSSGKDILSEPQYAELFEGLGCLPGQYSIKIDPSITPTIHPPRKIPISLKDKVHQELQRME